MRAREKLFWVVLLCLLEGKSFYLAECGGCGWHVCLMAEPISLPRSTERLRAHHNNPDNRHGAHCPDGMYRGQPKRIRVSRYTVLEIEKALELSGGKVIEV